MREEAVDPIDLSGVLPRAVVLTAADVSDVVEELATYHAHFAGLFQRPEQRLGAEAYLRGLLTADVPSQECGGDVPAPVWCWAGC
jgi:hypothetical protein